MPRAPPDKERARGTQDPRRCRMTYGGFVQVRLLTLDSVKVSDCSQANCSQMATGGERS